MIRVERSGGFAGLPDLNEIDSKDLPPDLVKVAKEIMLAKKASTVPLRAHKGSGDYYSYKISIEDKNNRNIVECNELNIKDDLKLLIKYIETNSKKSK